VTLIHISLLSSLPTIINSKRCIGYDFDGSNVDEEDFSGQRYTDGDTIPNVGEYLAPL
jgi:hypothetical protein